MKFSRFGKTVCKPIGPGCSECHLNDRCNYYETVCFPGIKKRSRKGKLVG